MWRNTLVFGCLCALGISSAEDGAREAKIVETAQGEVRGYKDSKYNIYEFHGIPYATAPTGTNRFKAPLPPPVWLQPLDAINNNIACPQATIILPGTEALTFTMQEDCLIANVFIPDTEEKNLPVVVYIHGGAFQSGYGDMMMPKKLVTEHNVIVVTFNYRLGIQGFLCLGTEDVPGNAGMKDQVELLRWVKKNIANFGGNPDEMTIYGSSAGSASVDLLMLSKSAEGLFNKVIAESAGNIAALTIQSDPLENAKIFARTMNVSNLEDVYALEKFYTTAPIETLIKDPFWDRTDSTFLFSPCVERTSAEAFLDESPVDILKNGHYKKVPLLYGFTNMEGLFRMEFFDFWKHKMNEKFSDFLPADLNFDSEKQKEEVANSVKEFYFGDKPVDNDTVLAYVIFFTDVLFVYPMLRSVRLQVENGHNQIYLYEYSFVDSNTPPVPYTTVQGADHCAQTTAVFGELYQAMPEEFYNFTEEFQKMSSTVRQLWANFIKTGKPVPEGSPLPAWPPVRGGSAPHMSLGTELELRGSLLERRTRFWDDIYAKHYRDPLAPPAPPAKHTELLRHSNLLYMFTTV